jgi:hypothetical protein
LGPDEYHFLSFQACRGRVDVQNNDEVDKGVEIPMSRSHTGPPTNTGTTSDAGGIYDDYTGRQPGQFGNDFYGDRNTNSHEQTGGRNAMTMESAEAKVHRLPITTPKTMKTETKPENIEVFQIPCFNDFLVIFSSPAGMYRSNFNLLWMRLLSKALRF